MIVVCLQTPRLGVAYARRPSRAGTAHIYERPERLEPDDPGNWGPTDAIVETLCQRRLPGARLGLETRIAGYELCRACEKKLWERPDDYRLRRLRASA